MRLARRQVYTPFSRTSSNSKRMMLQTSLPSVVSNSLVNIERKSEQNGVTVKKTQDNKAAAYGRRSLCLGLTTCLSIALALQPAIAEEKVVENPYIQGWLDNVV